MSDQLVLSANGHVRAGWRCVAAKRRAHNTCWVVLLAMLAPGLWGSAAMAADEEWRSARIHLQKGRFEEALEAYEALASLENDKGGDRARAAIGKSRCHEALGEWKEATAAVESQLAAFDKNAPLRARLAELLLAQGRYEEARKQIDDALKIDPDLPSLRLVAADLDDATGRAKEAEEGYRWFIRYYNRAQPSDAETLVIVARGSVAYARRRSVSQVFEFVVNTLCPDALKADPDCWQAHYVAGMLLLEKHNRAQALPELRKALTINARAAEVHAALARAAADENNPDDVKRHADNALDADPRFGPALHVLADLQIDDENLAGARETLALALEVNPHHEETLGRLAACYLLEDGPPTAADLDTLFERLDAIDSAKFENPGRFLQLMVAAARRNPRPGVLLFVLGTSLETRRKFDLAERCYRQAMLSAPQLPEPKTALGMLYLRIGRNQDAAKILDKAFESDPYHVRVSNLRKVLKLLEGYESLPTDHFVIRYDSQADKILAHYMAEYLEEEYPALVAQFGFEPPTRTQFEIYNKGKGLSAHQWFSARIVGLPWVQTIGASTGMIVAMASPTATEKPFNWARVLKHEFVHVITLQQTNFNIPHWFTEALAVMSEGYPRIELWNQLLRTRVPRGELMNLDSVNQGFIRPKSSHDWHMAYCQSQLYAEHLIARFGKDAPARLLEAYRNNLSTEQALNRVFNVSKADFEESYSKHLADVVAGLSVVESEKPATLAELEKLHLAAPEDPAAAGRYAFELYKANQRQEARKLAVAALETNPGEPFAALVMARLALRAEDSAAAIEWLEPAVDETEPNPDVLDLLTELLLKRNESVKAIELFELGLKHRGDYAPWLKGLSACFAKTKNTARLKETLVKLSLADADDAAPRQMLAQMFLDEKDFTQAIRYGKLALHVDVLDTTTHTILAAAYAGANQHEKARHEWSVIVQLNPDDLDSQLELARAELAAGKKADASDRLKELLKKHPGLNEAEELLEKSLKSEK
jgi:cellulose synthase operon protein C